TVSDNYAEDDGGGIRNSGTLTMTNCTVSGNTCYGDDGGGIHNDEGTLTMTNCTVSDNYADDDGGGIDNDGEDGDLEMTNCTITGNDAGNDGGGIDSGDDDNIKNSIIANNTCGDDGPDFRGGMDSYGYNLIGDTEDCTGYIGTDITDVDPNLGPLANNGGLTQTHALLSGSPAINAASCTDIDGDPVTTDQRGVSRPQGSRCDIGAYEYPQAPLVNPIPAFMIIANYHLRQANTCLGCITENLPEDVPEDVQELLDEMQEHINNANTTGNPIYANNELLKAKKCCEDIQEILGITCPL
ncbi:MAG: hypothetical protein KAT49_06665, partial [Methanomicrobia archaeon]|nr:hypothetical protein [Methanomicrobia archaeon]